MDFMTKWNGAIDKTGSLVCVGLDPDIEQMPERFRSMNPESALANFCVEIVTATSDVVSAYKPNLGFFVRWGVPGLRALEQVRCAIPDNVPIILDCKVGDMGNTSAAYADGYFGTWNFDAITANPYLGEEGLAPFLDVPGKAVFILARTSNPGSDTIQGIETTGSGDPLYLRVAHQIEEWNSKHPATAGLVAGATFPSDLAAIREACPKMPILVPGIGVQGGALADSLLAGLDDQRRGLLIAASRSVLYAGNGNDFAEMARETVSTMNRKIATELERIDSSRNLVRTR